MKDEIAHAIAKERAAIAALIDRQFKALTWTEAEQGNAQDFFSGFHDDARLYAAARPASGQTATAFWNRMMGLREEGTLSTFEEKGDGLHIAIAGNIAVALAGCEMHENRSSVTRDISAFLLVKESTGWKIVSQAWDIVDAIGPVFAANGLQGSDHPD